MAYAERALSALGDETRRAILERLRRGPSSVAEIAAGLPVSRPAVSQHLKVLKGAGLVSDRKNGARRVYRVEPGGLDAVRRYLEELWDEVLASFKNHAEATTKERR